VQKKSGGTWGPAQEIWNSQSWDFKGSTYDGAASSVIWKTVYVGVNDLGLTGATVRFVYEFDSFDASNNDFEGAYVDDFKVFTLCDDAYECLSPAECGENTPGDPNCSIEVCDGADGASGQSGTCTATANTLLEGCCVQEVVGDISFDFDGPCSMEGWVASPTPEQTSVAWQTWNQQNQTAGGECALYFGDPSTGNYDNPGQVPQGMVTSPTWEIPAGVDQVDVSFWIWMDLEDTWSITDVVRLHLGLKFWPSLPPNEDDIIWSKPCDAGMGLCEDELLVDYCNSWGCSSWPWGSWQKVTVPLDLTQYTDYDYFQFSFEFNAGDSQANEGVGVFVDDFKVETSCQ